MPIMNERQLVDIYRNIRAMQTPCKHPNHVEYVEYSLDEPNVYLKYVNSVWFCF
jgi:hypothetical protein